MGGGGTSQLMQHARLWIKTQTQIHVPGHTIFHPPAFHAADYLCATFYLVDTQVPAIAKVCAGRLCLKHGPVCQCSAV